MPLGTLTRDYLSVPRRLLLELAASGTPRDNLTAIGLYLLLCRQYLIEQQPIPLSRADARRFDSALTDGGFTRGINRLVAGGWLIKQTGYKAAYRPCWGRGPRRCVARPWTIGAPQLGCPSWVACDAIRVERSILDLFLGRLRPGLPATVERYVTAPLLTLAQVGAYVAAVGGYAIDSDQAKALARWGLWRDGQAQRVPDEHLVLALVSQRAMLDGPRLTEAGWRRLGWPQPTPPARVEEPATTAPLFFVPKELIGSWSGQQIGTLIGCHSDCDEAFSAAPSAESSPSEIAANMTGNHGESQDSEDLPPYPPTADGCGGGEQSEKVAQEIPSTEAAQLLAAIGCYPTTIAELGGLPVELVRKTIAYAQRQRNLSSVAAWVVDALRRSRAGGWRPPAEEAQRSSERWSADKLRQMTNGYGDLFRLGSDTSDLPEAAGDPTSVLSAHAWPSAPASTPGGPSERKEIAAGCAQAATTAAVLDDVHGPSDKGAGETPPPLADMARAFTQARQVRVLLRERSDRTYHLSIDRLQLVVQEEATEVRCVTERDQAVIGGVLLGMLCDVLAELGLPAPKVVVVQRTTLPARPPDLRRSRWAD
ncbi:MAG TPA: hypothetical protein VFS21_15125 [Roseiflexaceae bacterium]|nr:hypothetical protein [Roseiflexaceae bacterium]